MKTWLRVVLAWIIGSVASSFIKLGILAGTGQAVDSGGAIAISIIVAGITFFLVPKKK